MITLEQAKEFCKYQASEFEKARADSTDFSGAFDLLRKQKEWEHLCTELEILEKYMKESGIKDEEFKEYCNNVDNFLTSIFDHNKDFINSIFGEGDDDDNDQFTRM